MKPRCLGLFFLNQCIGKEIRMPTVYWDHPCATGSAVYHTETSSLTLLKKTLQPDFKTRHQLQRSGIVFLQLALEDLVLELITSSSFIYPFCTQLLRRKFLLWVKLNSIQLISCVCVCVCVFRALCMLGMHPITGLYPQPWTLAKCQTFTHLTLKKQTNKKAKQQQKSQSDRSCATGIYLVCFPSLLLLKSLESPKYSFSFCVLMSWMLLPCYSSFRIQPGSQKGSLRLGLLSSSLKTEGSANDLTDNAYIIKHP